jgi:hypothetical protein
LEEGQVVIVKEGVKLSYGDYTEENETSFESVRDENKIEVVSESKHVSDYESVLQEYTTLMENTSLTLQKKLKMKY